MFFAGLVLAALLTQPESGEAIPAFARKYRMSCTTCHAPIPRLKAYGDDFAGNGFVLEDQDAPRYFVDEGDDKLDLIRDFPIAARFDGFVKYETATDRDVDFSTPYALKLLSGGALTKNVAYYFYFYMSERGEVAGVEDAYLMFNNLFGSELDIYLGQFQASDPLFKRELRLTYEDYELYRRRIGSSLVNLAYDKGIMLTYGFESGTDVILEVVNGNGIGEADDAHVFDNDKYKNFMGRISQDLTDYLRVGGFGYYGKEADNDNNKNELWMAGADATLAYLDRLELNLQWIERRDDNPVFADTKPDDELETLGAMAELIFMPTGERSDWYAVALYNRVDSDLDVEDYETFSAHIGHVLRTNIRLILEYTYDIENEESRVITGFVSAF
ncbi:hypothetical protein GF377_01915 [candidate division GN15 bacterium]|nr:hypothetical protein [candidate division GN15 bacterium]